MSENKRLSERNAKIASMLSDGEQLKNFYRFISQNPYINLHDACQMGVSRNHGDLEHRDGCVLCDSPEE